MPASLLQARMHWLQPQEDGTIDLSALQLDIVGFLAILGEGSVLANAQVSTLSRWVFLPRLLPAPQALMRPTRPLHLEPVPGIVSGVWSGNNRDYINHIANIVCDANKLPPYSVRVVEIRRKEDKPLKAKAFAPLTFVAILGCVLSVMLLAMSIHFRDGMSIVATINLSLLSSLIGYGNKWTLQLPKRFRKMSKHQKKTATFNRFPIKAGNTHPVSETVASTETEKQMPCPEAEADPKPNRDFAPKGDVVIRYPKGSFLVVRCSEDIARELYFAPEEIEYLLEHAWAYRLLSLIGTMMLMGGVICLANARIENQIAWAGAYMLLGSSYWIVAALPGKLHWDTTAYEVVQEALSDSDLNTKGYPSLVSETFTQALWRAIVVSKDTAWVRQSNACPSTRTWDDWLDMARACSREVRDYETLHNGQKITTWEIPEWDPQEYLNELLESDSKNRSSHSMAQHA